MKTKPVVFILLFLLSAPVLFAQRDADDRDKKQKVEDLKIAFITRELDLSSEDAQQFWPAYNEMTDKIKEEKKKQRKLTKDLREHPDTYSESEYKRKSEAYMDSGIRESELRKEYHTKIAAIIGYKKATKLLSLEQRFKRELLKRLNNDRRPQNTQRRPNGPRANN